MKKREHSPLPASPRCITADLRERLKAMVDFRNVAVHDYRKLNLEVVRKIAGERLADCREFGRTVLEIDQ